MTKSAVAVATAETDESNMPMVWSRKFPVRLLLDDGRTLTTLADARDLVIKLPAHDQAQPDWQKAGDLLMQAAYRSRKDPIADAGRQVQVALESGGLVGAAGASRR